MLSPQKGITTTSLSLGGSGDYRPPESHFSQGSYRPPEAIHFLSRGTIAPHHPLAAPFIPQPASKPPPSFAGLQLNA